MACHHLQEVLLFFYLIYPHCMRCWLTLLLLSLHAAPTPTRLLRNQDGRREAFTGIGRLRTGPVCTAFLLQPAPNNASGPVYALTNGHCVVAPSSNRVFHDLPAPANSSLTFHFFLDTPTRQRPYGLRNVPYATLKGLDIAVVELDTDWPTLAAAGIKPVPLRAVAAQPDDAVYTVGAPADAVAAEESWLRRSDCTVSAIAQLAEGPWQFHDALRFSCGGIYGGASGSPVFDSRTGEAVAIVNTSTQGQVYSSGDFPCFLNNPCELTSPRGDLVLDAGYALPLAGLAGCFDAEGRFALGASGCLLDPGVELEVGNAPFASVRPGTAWNVSLSHSTFTHYRYKAGPESTTNCRIDSGYSDPVPLAANPVIESQIGLEDGRYVLCLLGQGGGLAQQVRHATYVHTGVDTQPPVLSPQWSVRADRDFYTVQLFFLVPDLSDYRYKFGPDLAVDCDDVSNYNIYRRIPIRVPASASELIRFCVIAGDRNDNFTRPTQILLGENQPLPAGVVNSAGFEKGPLSPGAYASMFFASEVSPSIGMQLRDAAGAVFPIQGVVAGQQLNLIVPPETAPGPALLQVPGPFPASVLLDVQPISPGIFVNPDRAARGFLRSGQAGAIAGCSPESCGVVPLPVPAVIELQANGLRALEGKELEVRLAGHSIPGTVQFGSVHFSIPADFPYRGQVSVQLVSGGVRSNVAYLLLKDEGI